MNATADVFIDGMTLPPDPRLEELLRDFRVGLDWEAALREKAEREKAA